MYALFAWIQQLLYRLRYVLVIVLAIGLPLAFYLAFIVDEPVFTPEDDVELGRMSAQSIADDPEQFPLLDETDYPETYAHLRRLVDRILQSPEIQYRDVFAYDQIRIIDRDDVLNAFCTPGGFIYVYTGLIKYLDHEDHLAGVLGHEIAHAERRHSSRRLQKEYGVKAMLAFAVLATPTATLGDAINAKIFNDLVNLSYSRDQEAEADALSVAYLTGSGYACDGAAGFFVKLLDAGDDVRVPEFLSDHPSSDRRVQDIERDARERGCDTTLSADADWKAFQASLPASQEASLPE